jgi:hypothetical protein
MPIAKAYYVKLKPVVLTALYYQFQNIQQDEKWDKKLTGSSEFKILCIVGMPTAEQLFAAIQQGRVVTEILPQHRT